MNLIDILIILLLLLAFVRGVNLGFTSQVFSTAGFVSGLLLGIFLQNKIHLSIAQNQPYKFLLSIIIIIVITGCFTALGEYIGEYMRNRLTHIRSLHLLNIIDRFLGALMAGATLLLAIWIGAAIFNEVPLNGLQQQIRGSGIIAELDNTLPPAPNIVTSLGHLFGPNGFPDVFKGLEPAVNTNTPLPSVGQLDSAVQEDKLSVVKIEGSGCGGISQGSGFIGAKNVVITNAHVVAGVQQIHIIDGNGEHAASVVLFDPNLDLAVLRTTGLAGAPLLIDASSVNNGTPAAVLGYPGDGNLTVGTAVVLESFEAVGRNIYNQGDTQRQVYSIKAIVRPGNSGGPLIAQNGQVIGVVFAESTTYDDVGYALTSPGIVSDYNQAIQSSQPVSTGNCTEG